MAATVDGLNADFANRINRLVAMSGGRIKLVSGFRSVERQRQLFDAAVKKYGSVAAARKWVAPPGKSNHGKGAAMDLGGDLALAHKLAPQLGLRFPMKHEPWHIEPAGQMEKSHPHAYTPGPGQDVHEDDDEDGTHTPLPEVNRNDLGYQLTSFMDVVLGGGSTTDDGFSDPMVDEDMEINVGEGI